MLHIKKKVNIATAILYPLINRKSKLNLRNKLLIYVTMIRPLITYASPAWGYIPTTQIDFLQRLQNKLLRMITGAPWFIRNSQIRKDCKISTILEHLKNLSQVFFKKCEIHPNILLKEAINYIPTDYHKYKRPRHLLIS